MGHNGHVGYFDHDGHAVHVGHIGHNGHTWIMLCWSCGVSSLRSVFFLG